MSKRFISFLIAVAILVVATPIPIAGAESRASDYITQYTATLSSGNSSGQLNITYYVSASAAGITRLGVATIFVYHTDGSLARIITGNATNGLIKTSGSVARGTYSFAVEPGTAYYCSVRFVAENSSGFEYRNYTTGTVVAPR